MPSLAEAQAAFIACLQHGPEHFPTGMFAQADERALLAMRAHANTISFGRIIALKDSFPRLLEHMGEDAFVPLARDYCDTDAARASDLAHIGGGFADFLAVQGQDALTVWLARYDYGWLRSYRAPAAAALTLADIAALDEAELLALPIALHPAAQILPATPAIAAQAGFTSSEPVAAIIVTRPEAEVINTPIGQFAADMLLAVPEISVMGNFIAAAIEKVGESAAMERIVHLIQIGCLTGNKGRNQP